jgi:hypothetical protein
MPIMIHYKFCKYISHDIIQEIYYGDDYAFSGVQREISGKSMGFP